MRFRLPTLLLLLLLGAISLFAPHGRTQATDPPYGTTPVGAALWRIYSDGTTGNKWVTANITIGLGDSVLWEWSNAIHNVRGFATTDAWPALCAQPQATPSDFNSGFASPTGSYTYTFSSAGVYYYACDTHCAQKMWGVITVSSLPTYPTTAPPTTTPPPTTLPPTTTPQPTTPPPTTQPPTTLPPPLTTAPTTDTPTPTPSQSSAPTASPTTTPPPSTPPLISTQPQPTTAPPQSQQTIIEYTLPPLKTRFYVSSQPHVGETTPAASAAGSVGLPLWSVLMGVLLALAYAGI